MENIFSDFSIYEFKIFVSNIKQNRVIGKCEIFLTSNDVLFKQFCIVGCLLSVKQVLYSLLK